MLVRTLASLALVFLLAACGGRPEGGALVPTLAAAPGATDHTMLVASMRARVDGPAIFSGERADHLDFAALTVSVPPVHVSGKVEWPDGKPPGDPAKNFVTRAVSYINGEDAFSGRLRQAVAARPKGKRTVAVFVHGYNTDFDEAAYRFTQMVHDTGFDGVPLLFTWASRGSVLDYVYDRDSATAARDGLEHTLAMAAASGAEQVAVFAHSMGTFVTVEALRQAKIAGHPDFGGKLRTVFLASPDIDVDVFKAEMRRIGVPASPYILFASKDDQALLVSSLIAGDKPRLGAYTADKKEIADLGVVVVDLSDLQGEGGLNHDKFTLVSGDVGRKLALLAATGQLDARTTSLGEDVGAAGSSIGGLVGATAGLAITLPAFLITAPFKAISQ